MRLRYAVLMLLTLNVPAVLAGESAKPKLTYQQDFAKWKGELEDDLKKNWLTVVGLFWLKEGANRVGGDPSDDVPLPKDKVPAQVGEIDFHNNAVSFKATAGASVKSGGKLVQSTALQPDVSGKPTKLEVGDVYFYVIQRGNRFGVRVKDVHSKQLAAFKGTKFYPAQPKYIVTGTFVPF